jgi:predicted nucleic acid-binding protein
MNIVIDTNLIHSDWKLKSEDFKAFVNFVERTNSRVYIPKIVWEETRLNYRKDIEDRHKKYEAAGKLFGGSLVDVPDLNVVILDYDEEVAKYIKWLTNNLRIGESNILPYGDYTERIANRALYRRKPFNRVNDREYKDTLVWETVLDIVSGSIGERDDEVVLISNDGNAFEADKVQKNSERQQKAERQAGVLHPHLQDDIEQLTSNDTQRFYFYESLGKFLSEHFTPIKGIDKESFRQYLGLVDSGFVSAFWDGLMAQRATIIKAIDTINSVRTIDIIIEEFNIFGISEVENFYISSYRKGVEFTASGIVIVSIEVPVRYSYGMWSTNQNEAARILVEAKINIKYSGSKPFGLHIESLSIPIGNWLSLPQPARQVSLTARINEIYDRNPILGIVAAMHDTLFEKPQQFEIDWEERIKRNHKSQNSESKYLPRKTPADSRKKSQRVNTKKKR